jgi:DNA-binding winged helix-turn-helix (wHTH) protein
VGRNKDVFLFEGFRLDRSGLSRCNQSGAFVPVPVGSRTLEILGFLLQRSGDLVSRDEIMNAVWPGTIVENSNLPVQIAALRRLLDNGRANGSCIQTVPGRGYRFVGVVTRASPESALALPDKPSIVVLPFANMSGDPEQEYFADGMAEEINCRVLAHPLAFRHRP